MSKRTDDAALVVKSLHQQSHTLTITNRYVLGTIIGVILVSIYLFVKSDSIVIQSASYKEAEETLAKEEGTLEQDVEKIRSRRAGLQTRRDVLKQAESLFLTIANCYREIERLVDISGQAKPDEKKTNVEAQCKFLIGKNGILDRAEAILNATTKPSLPDEINIVDASGAVTIASQIALQTFKTAVDKSGVDLNKVKEDMSQIRSFVTELAEQPQPSDDKIARIRNIMNLNKNKCMQMKDSFAADKSAQELDIDRQMVADDSAELQRKQESLAKVKSARDALYRNRLESLTSVSSWIPSLSVRVGAIVLALFMTQFLASIYRYNAMQASRYALRADALGLVLLNLPEGAAESNANLFKTDELVQLLNSLIQDKIDFVLPDSAIDKFIEAAKKMPK